MLKLVSLTIRGRIITVFAIFPVCVGALTVFDWWNIVTIVRKFLSANILKICSTVFWKPGDMKKKFFFYHDRESLNETIVYISKVIDISEKLTEDIERVVGKPSYRQFQQNLKKL